jgi:Mrp family chromosome partitioning ATPase
MSKNFELLNKALREDLMQAQSYPHPQPVGVDSMPETSSEAAELLSGGPEEVALTNLVQRVFLRPEADAPRMVGFAAVEAQAGCTWICAHVAKILAAQVAGSVCVVDANLRTPGLHTQFAITNGANGTGGNHARPLETLADYAQPLSKKLWVVRSGYNTSGLDPVAVSERMRSQVASLRGQFEYVLLDLPPLNKYADAIVLGGACDGMIIVLRANASRRDATLRAVADLKAANVRVLGVALNQRTFSVPNAIYRRL